MDFLGDRSGGFVLEAESEPRAQPAAHLRAGLTTNEGRDCLVKEGGPGPKNSVEFSAYRVTLRFL